MEGDDDKFLQYANFIADAYEEDGHTRSARIIRSKLDGSYKKEPKIVVLDNEIINKIYNDGYNTAFTEYNTPIPPIITSEWAPSRCPRCDKDLDEECEDGYYRRAVMTERCPQCGQKLNWTGINY